WERSDGRDAFGRRVGFRLRFPAHGHRHRLAHDRLARHDRSLALLRCWREVRKLHEIALTEEARNALEGNARFGDERRHGARRRATRRRRKANEATGLLLERREDLVGRRFEAIEAETRAEVTTKRVARPIEVFGVAVDFEKAGVADFVQLFERDFPRRAGW